MFRLSKAQGYLLNFIRQDRGSYLFFFLVGLALRWIPELLIKQYPVGYETITWYAPIMTRFQEMSLANVFVETFYAGPLFYVLMWFATTVSGAHAFPLLKVAGPVLYGCLAASFFMFLRRGLSFGWKMAFVATLLLVFQVAALRIGWDRFRTVLGLIFLFTTVIALKSDHKYKWWLVAVPGVLAALSREYVAVVLFVTVFGFVILEKKDRVMSLVALAPTLVILMVTVSPGLLGLVSNYVPEGQYASRSYLWVVQDAFVILAVCYLGLLPFVLRGWRRDKLVGPMMGWLLVASFSVVSPWFAVPGYQRWLMLLVFPFSVYAAWGFERFQMFSKRRIWMLATVVLLFAIIGVGYSTGEFSYVGQMTNSYVAINLVQSSITWDLVDDVKAGLVWLNENAVRNSSVLAEESFYGWTLIYFERANEDVKVIPYGAASSPMPALEVALHDGFSRIYLIWYSEHSLNSFEAVHSQNAISIFQYMPPIS